MKLFFPGSFDPFTIGHADIVKRAISMGNTVVIGVGENSKKTPCLTLEDRIEGITEYFKYTDYVSVVSYSGLTVEAAHRNGCDAILRGIRNAADFEYEKNIAEVNRAISKTNMETVFIICDPKYQHISSSMVKEVNRYCSAEEFVIPTLRDFFY